MTVETTQDGFLDRRLLLDQPRRGFRAGHDSVLLAAAVPALSGQSVLELGSGVGVASLCLAARVADLRILGVELDSNLVALANGNAARNGFGTTAGFVIGDARDFAPAEAPFDHVFFNPPFHPMSGQSSPNAARDRAMRDIDDALVQWTAHATTLLQGGGTITVIMRADRVEEWCASAQGAMRVTPLLARAGEPPKRVIARLTPGGEASLISQPPFVLHQDDGKPTEAAEAILRHGAAFP